MPQIFRSIVIIGLVGVIFITQGGIVVFKHSCKLRGEKVFIFSKPQNLCCSACEVKDTEGCHRNLQKSSCCVESTKIYKLTTDFSLNSTAKLYHSPDLPLLFSFEPFLAISLDKQFFSPFQFANPPPQRYGKTLLQFICRYLI
ncbi:MAG: hypothetical protein RMJ97_09620 [Raineya sp.]|nr:hypothetical protein [Raineya sp.]MDW8297123.1 hypothetical protein [Raineya sp.]